MNERLKKWGLNSPFWIRTIAVNLNTMRLNHLRHGGNYKKYLQEKTFSRYFEYSEEEIKHQQLEKLQKLINSASRKVEHYHQKYKRLKLPESLDDLQFYPTLSKDEARAAGKNLINQDLKKSGGRIHTLTTSGSTGTPYSHRIFLDYFRMLIAIRDNYYAFHSCPISEWRLRLGGRLFMDVSIKKPPFWVFDYFQKQIYFSAYHNSDESLEKFTRILKKHQPQYIVGYSAAIYLLANFCRRTGFTNFKPRHVFFDSEMVLDSFIKEVEEAWGCKTSASYGLEVGHLAYTCKKGNYHLNSLETLVEVLDEEGKVCAPGQAGEIVATDLNNYLNPLIRYRTSDIGVWSEKRCDCGWNTPVLERIEGRVDDIVVLPNGRRIARGLHSVFGGLSNIRMGQIIQEKLDYFRILVVPEDGYINEIGQKVLANAHSRLGNEVKINLEIVKEVILTEKRKFRAVISKVKYKG